MAYWYSQHAIDFTTRQQIEWLVENLPLLRDGIWPPRPDVSSAIDPRSLDFHHVTARAYFETPVQYAAEIEIRLITCHEDGVMVRLLICYGESLETIARSFRLHPDEVWFRVNAALNWTVGRERKRGYDSRARHYYGRQGKSPAG